MDKDGCIICLLIFLHCLCIGCRQRTSAPLFTALPQSRTGIAFSNNLTPKPDFNMFHYMYFYNGAGVGAGDFNNDGWTDLFFASNQSANKLYLNQKNLRFKDVSQAAQLPDDGGWSTGVSVVDINNDGMLDIYVCRIGNYEKLHSKNQLLVCKGIDENGVPFYKDEAAAWGIDFSGFSTQAAFFDYDLDGDLDLFLLNHSIHQNGNFAERSKFSGTYHPLSGDRMYRNDGSVFTDVTRACGINSSAISYGLGIGVSDINLDGYPDLYAGNDFHENDYLYINQKNGTFKETGTEALMHTSQFSMGIDVADVTNDGFGEIISTDMLPSDPYILKRSLGGDEFDIAQLKINYGYSYQYSRNNLQWNRRNGLFSEVGLMAGIAATDWSWAPLWMDFDNDGWKDLFISNGIPKRLNDIDYVNHVSNDEIQEKIRGNKLAESDMALIKKFPEIKLPNHFFKNNGSLLFQDVASSIENNTPGFSNGAAYADLDNDGDLDIVVNNIDAPVIVYQNTATQPGDSSFLQLELSGPAKNRNAVGAQVFVFAGSYVQRYEKYPVHGFQSSMEVPLHIGLNNVQPDSIFLVWPDNTYEKIPTAYGRKKRVYKNALPAFDYKRIAEFNKNLPVAFDDITAVSTLHFKHNENAFVEFDREPLIPFMVSKEGPAVAVADINGDGTDDVFFGSAKGFKSEVHIQKAGGFQKMAQPDLEKDSTYEDVDAIWVDVNGDKAPDLVVASGGNEYTGNAPYLQPRVYLNDGHGVLKKLVNAFPHIYLTASCVAPYDFNGDGATDLFIGGRAEPWAYGKVPASYLLQNDGSGKFKDVTKDYSAALAMAGFVKDAVWTDIDKDGDADLILALEWGCITAFIKEGNTFVKKELTPEKGLWSFITPLDADGDGDTDFIAGNLGLNTRLQASAKEPLRLYYNDFDDNGTAEQLLTYYLKQKEILFATKDELQKQLPQIKKKFLYAEDFAHASLKDIIDAKKLNEAVLSTANYLYNAIIINNGNGSFVTKALPEAAQVAPLKDAVVTDINQDGLPDVFTAGNFYESNIQMGRYDADFGTILLNKSKGIFEAHAFNQLPLKGQVRHLQPLIINHQKAWLVVRNNDSTTVLARHQPKQRPS